MGEQRNGAGSVQRRNSRNLEELAAYLRDMLEDRERIASDSALLVEALDSVQRELLRSSAMGAQQCSAA
jgi:hypothetical protein